MNHDDIKQALICAPNETRPLKEIILRRNTFSNCHIKIYRKGMFIETETDTEILNYYKYSNITKIYCIFKEKFKTLCIDYLNTRVELTSSYCPTGKGEEPFKMMDDIVILLTKYWKSHNTK